MATQRLKSWLASRRASWVVVLVAIAVTLPSIGNGFAVDDHVHEITLTQDARWSMVAEPWYRLFTFYDDDSVRRPPTTRPS